MNNNLKKLTLSALMATLTFIMTRYFAIPTAIGGSINVGDSIVLLSGFILGPFYGAITAAVGSALADLLSPYAIYTLATFIIKGLVALSAAMLFKSFKKLNLKINLLISATLAEVIMVVGYFIFEAYFLKFGVIVAGYEVFNNLIQAVSSIIIVSIMYVSLNKSSILRNIK